MARNAQCSFYTVSSKVKRWVGASGGKCSKKDGECWGRNFVGVVDGVVGEHSFWPDDNDPLWDVKCEACGSPCKDKRYTTGALIFVDRKGREVDGENLPAGAMWFADWYPWKGPDGHSLVVKLPNGHHWLVDNRASNCTMKDDDVHRCWVRHGEPPNITVDKKGHTCKAGGGSIWSGDWHGFLRNGRLEEC